MSARKALAEARAFFKEKEFAKALAAGHWDVCASYLSDTDAGYALRGWSPTAKAPSPGYSTRACMSRLAHHE
jgi:hypothetical protein